MKHYYKITGGPIASIFSRHLQDRKRSRDAHLQFMRIHGIKLMKGLRVQFYPDNNPGAGWRLLEEADENGLTHAINRRSKAGKSLEREILNLPAPPSPHELRMDLMVGRSDGDVYKSFGKSIPGFFEKEGVIYIEDGEFWIPKGMALSEEIKASEYHLNLESLRKAS